MTKPEPDAAPAEIEYLHELAQAEDWLKAEPPKRSAADSCARNYADSDGFVMLMAALNVTHHGRFHHNQIRNMAVQYEADRAALVEKDREKMDAIRVCIDLIENYDARGKYTQRLPPNKRSEQAVERIKAHFKDEFCAEARAIELRKGK